MNVILFHNDHQHVLPTHVANFSVVRAVKNYGVILTHYKYIRFLSLPP